MVGGREFFYRHLRFELKRHTNGGALGTWHLYTSIFFLTLCIKLIYTNLLRMYFTIFYLVGGCIQVILRFNNEKYVYATLIWIDQIIVSVCTLLHGCASENLKIHFG